MFRSLKKKPATVSSCPCCGECYKSAETLRAPLLLGCSHTCCEECIRNAVYNDGKVVCKECGHTTIPESPLTQKRESIRGTFPPSMHTLSEVHKQEKLKPVDESCIGFKSRKQTQEKQASPLALLGSCAECNKVHAQLKCAECKVMLCPMCDLKIHGNKILQNHTRGPINDIGFDQGSQISVRINEYNAQLKQYYCKLMKKRMKIENTIKKLNHEQVLKEAKSSYLNVPETEEALNQFFTYCHNIIQNLQAKVIKELHAKGLSLDRSRTACLNELEIIRQNIDQTVTEVFKAVNLHVYESSAEELLQKCQNLMDAYDEIRTTRPVVPRKKIEMPTHHWVPILEEQLNFDFGEGGKFILMCAPFDEPDEKEMESLLANPLCGIDVGDSVEVLSSVSYQISENSVDYLNNCSEERRPSITQSLNQLSLSSNNEYHSVRENYPRQSSYSVIGSPRSTPGYRAMNGGSGSVRQIKGPSLSTCGITSTPILYPHNPRAGQSHFRDMKTGSATSMRSKMSKQQIKFKEGCRESVIISHVENPSCFFVQLKELIHVLEKYRKFFAKAPSLSPLKVEDVKIGNLYLAQCSDDNWYRARIREFVPNSQTNEVSVTQIDTGVTEVVELSRFRRLDDLTKAISMEPELAIQCSVHDCYPCGPMWQQKDIELFNEVLRNKEITMLVKKVQSNKLEVDLNWPENGGSIRDYLVMSKVACISSKRDSVASAPVTKETKYFLDKDFKPKEWVEVKIASTMGPDDFYVRRNCPSINKSFAKMMQHMDGYYKSNNNYHTLTIHNPCIGMPVAAQFSVDNKWYRAEIISLKPQAKKAEVRYVDFGNTEILAYSKIRMLAEEFLRFTVQAIKCTLSEILPVNNRYNMMAVKFFAKEVEEKDLKIVIQDIQHDEKSKMDVLHVLLYVITEEGLIHVNSLMVEEKHARQVGMNLGPSFYPKLKSVPNKYVNKEEVPSSNTRDSGSHSNDDEDDNKDEETRNKFHVTIVNFDSPNQFYVSLVEQLKNIQELTNDMLKYYRDDKNNKETTLESIDCGTKCAVFMADEKKWYRGVVKGINEDDTIKVFLKDVARLENVSKDNLRSLTNDFTRIIDGTIECHMADVPERTEWSSDLCDSLREEFKKYNSLYISYTGNSEDTSVPVVLWGKRVIHSGPFEPNTDDWTNINTILLTTLTKEEKASENTGEEITGEYEPPRENLLKTLDTVGGEVNPEENVKEWLAKSIREAEAKGVEYADIVENGVPPERLFSPNKLEHSAGDANKNAVSGKAAFEVPDKDWVPAEPLTCSDFVGVPSYVDDNFNVYVQLQETQRNVLTVIASALELRYKDAPLLPVDLYWYPGQICVAVFYLDKKWYRGKVIEVKGDLVLVEYVDYGNVEWVNVENLRKNVTLTDLPIQCHKIPIRSDCVPKSPDGRWPTDVLDFVHHTILEKQCRFKLRKENDEDFYRIEKIVTPEKLDIFDVLVQVASAEMVSTKKSKVSPKNSVVEEISEQKKTSRPLSKCSETQEEAASDESSSIAAVESASNLDFSELAQVPGVLPMSEDPFSLPQNPQNNEIIVPNYELPPNLDVVTVEVTEILDFDEIVVHVVNSNDESVNKNRKSFLEMTAELQKKGFEQPILKPPHLGRVCCTKFQDNLWYRVKVTGPCLDGENVPILYFDYGNSSTASVNELHELKRSWFYVPVQSIRCRLLDFGVESENKRMLVNMVNELLNNKYKAIIERSIDSEWYTIKLLEEDNS